MRRPRLILEINIGERLSVVVVDDPTSGLFLDGPGRREAVWAWTGQEWFRSTLTTLNRGSRSTWISKIKSPGQVASARRSATVFAFTGISCSTTTRMLSR